MASTTNNSSSVNAARTGREFISGLLRGDGSPQRSSIPTGEVLASDGVLDWLARVVASGEEMALVCWLLRSPKLSTCPIQSSTARRWLLQIRHVGTCSGLPR